MLRRLTILAVLATAFGTFSAAPASAATQWEYKCVTRGPVNHETVYVCARLYSSGAWTWYAYEGMKYYPESGYPTHTPGPHMYIDAVHLDFIESGLEYTAAVAPHLDGWGHISRATDPITFGSATCDASDVLAVVGYHIVWSNGVRTPSSGQATVRSPTAYCPWAY